MGSAKQFQFIAISFLFGVGIGKWLVLDEQVAIGLLAAVLLFGCFWGSQGWGWRLALGCGLAVILGWFYAGWLADGTLIRLPENHWLVRLAGAARGRFQEIISQLLPEPQAALASGLLIGAHHSYSLPASLKQAFINAGIIHIVAISGFNITLLLKMASDWLEWLGQRLAFIVGTLALIIFIAIVGGQASVVRAGIMGWLFLLARRLGRPAAVVNALLASAILMTIQEPGILLGDIGFQLSFMGMLGIIYLGPRISGWLESRRGHYYLPNWLSQTFGETLGAQLAVMPLVAYYFQRISLVFLLPNLLILPLILPPMVLGFLSAILGLLWLPLGQIAGLLLQPFLVYILVIGQFFGQLPLASVALPHLPWLWLAGYYGVGTMIVMFRRKRQISKS